MKISEPTSSEIVVSAGPRLRAVPAVTRAIAILRLLGRGTSPLTLREIALELKMVPSTCLHILRVLLEEELVKIDYSTKRYSLAVGILSLAKGVFESNPFPSTVQPMLDRMSAKWNVSAIGVEIIGIEHMVVLALSRSRAQFRLHVDVGSRFPALISATGRLVAAHTAEPIDTIERRVMALKWDRAPELATWRKEVQSARRNGYSLDRGNYIEGVAVMAVPVFDSAKRMTHSIVIAGVADKFAGNKAALIAKDLIVESQSLTKLVSSVR